MHFKTLSVKRKKVVLEIVSGTFEIAKQYSQTVFFFGNNYFNAKVLLLLSPKSTH